MAQVEPGFSTAISAVPPMWSKVKDLPHFAKLFNIYYRVLALQHVFNTNLAKSLTFLLAIHEETHRPSIISLETSITNYNNNHPPTKFDNIPGSLPPNYQIDGLAQQLVHATTSLAPSTNAGGFASYATSYNQYPSTFGPQPPGNHSNYLAMFGAVNAMVSCPFSKRKRIGDDSTGPSPRGADSNPEISLRLVAPRLALPVVLLGLWMSTAPYCYVQ